MAMIYGNTGNNIASNKLLCELRIGLVVSSNVLSLLKRLLHHAKVCSESSSMLLLHSVGYYLTVSSAMLRLTSVAARMFGFSPIFHFVQNAPYDFSITNSLQREVDCEPCSNKHHTIPLA